eukprot:TRINITY_DN1971_c0_g1_i1.p1 TRINITY_DN1971_c0_g1~~TRINITY_DN1971_c0_g1_i1.p1  ORF type:complete len:982 (+),score=128.42 TRINITY_DN1971_c0_g1_i1:46-2991(+)
MALPELMKSPSSCPALCVTHERSISLETIDENAHPALAGRQSIPDFQAFCTTMIELFDAVSSNKNGQTAQYIPSLARANPDLWGVAVCSASGQRFSLGDSTAPFCVQSCSKPITYCMAVELHGHKKVHEHVGHEPSGRGFNERILKQPENIPHNPLINAGAIMAASLVKMEETEWDRFDYVMNVWQSLCGGTKPGFQNSTFMGERATAARNNCLAWMMVESEAFPAGISGKVDKVLEAYFSWCSIETTCETMSIVAGTLANGGICPTTGERIFSADTVTKCLSLMASCGMYDASGDFAFTCGFPAKSGVSGVLCIVIPGICGIATFSPRLDSMGNSVRGIEFCKLLSSKLQVHTFDRLPGLSKSWDVGFASTAFQDDHASLWWAAARGDVFRLQQLAARKIEVSETDYDGRSALHLAACEGHVKAVNLLMAMRADVSLRDKYGNTPLDDAIRGEHADVVEAIKSGATDDVVFPQLPDSGAPISDALRETLRESGLDRYARKDLHIHSEEEQATMRDLLNKAIRGDLIIPNFPEFRRVCIDIQEQLADRQIDAQVAFCSIHGQTLSVPEDPQVKTIRWGALMPPFLYCMAVEELGHDEVHKVIGREPSGEKTETITFNQEGLPYNPFTMVGSLTLCALLISKASCRAEDASERLLESLRSLSPRASVRMTSAAAKAERDEWLHHATCLVHMMIHRGKFPESAGVAETLDLFFRCRSLESSLACVAECCAALANGGVCVTTGQAVFSPPTVRAILSLMLSCGLADWSGEFGYTVGIPAKDSAAAESVMLINPGVFGCCVREPEEGEVCGFEYCRAFAEKFRVHNFDGGRSETSKWVLRLYDGGQEEAMCTKLLLGAGSGDLTSVKLLHNIGCDLDFPDTDGRTAAHLAAAGGHVHVIKYLVSARASVALEDRWGNTPLAEAQREDQADALKFLASVDTTTKLRRANRSKTWSEDSKPVPNGTASEASRPPTPQGVLRTVSSQY